VTTINQAMGVGWCGEGAKQSPWQDYFRCGMLFEIQGMLKSIERLNTFQMCEGGWEKFCNRGRTPFGKTSIKVRLLLRISPLVLEWVSNSPSRCFLTLLHHFLLLTKHRLLSTVSLLLECIVLHRRLRHLPLSWPHIEDSVRISQATASWWFCDRAQ